MLLALTGYNKRHAQSSFKKHAHNRPGIKRAARRTNEFLL